MLVYGGLVELVGLAQTDQGTVLGLLLEDAQRLQQDQSTLLLTWLIVASRGLGAEG